MENPKPLKIAEGPWVHNEDGSTVELDPNEASTSGWVADCFDPTGEGLANNHCILVADAGNTYQATGLLPSEQSNLIAEKDKTILDLREALERVSSECHQQFKSRGAWDPLSNETLAAVDDVLIATKPQL